MDLQRVRSAHYSQDAKLRYDYITAILEVYFDVRIDLYLFTICRRHVRNHQEHRLLDEFHYYIYKRCSVFEADNVALMHYGECIYMAAAAHLLEAQVGRQTCLAKAARRIIVISARCAALDDEAPVFCGVPEWAAQIVGNRDWFFRSVSHGAVPRCGVE
jgi:hypothetical protein